MPLLKSVGIVPPKLQFSHSSHPMTQTFPLAEFLAMLGKSLVLETLTLDYPISDDNLITILKSTLSLTALHLSPAIPSSAHFFDMMRRGELLTMLRDLSCFTGSPDSLLDLLEHQCTCIGSQDPPGLRSAHIIYPMLHFMGDVLERFHDLEPQLLRDGRRITLKEHDP